MPDANQKDGPSPKRKLRRRQMPSGDANQKPVPSNGVPATRRKRKRRRRSASDKASQPQQPDVKQKVAAWLARHWITLIAIIVVPLVFFLLTVEAFNRIKEPQERIVYVSEPVAPETATSPAEKPKSVEEPPPEEEPPPRTMPPRPAAPELEMTKVIPVLGEWQLVPDQCKLAAPKDPYLHPHTFSYVFHDANRLLIHSGELQQHAVARPPKVMDYSLKPLAGHQFELSETGLSDYNKPGTRNSLVEIEGNTLTMARPCAFNRPRPKKLARVAADDWTGRRPRANELRARGVDLLVFRRLKTTPTLAPPDSHDTLLDGWKIVDPDLQPPTFWRLTEKELIQSGVCKDHEDIVWKVRGKVRWDHKNHKLNVDYPTGSWKGAYRHDVDLLSVQLKRGDRREWTQGVTAPKVLNWRPRRSQIIYDPWLELERRLLHEPAAAPAIAKLNSLSDPTEGHVADEETHDDPAIDVASSLNVTERSDGPFVGDYLLVEGVGPAYLGPAATGFARPHSGTQTSPRKISPPLMRFLPNGRLQMLYPVEFYFSPSDEARFRRHPELLLKRLDPLGRARLFDVARAEDLAPQLDAKNWLMLGKIRYYTKPYREFDFKVNQESREIELPAGSRRIGSQEKDAYWKGSYRADDKRLILEMEKFWVDRDGVLSQERDEEVGSRTWTLEWVEETQRDTAQWLHEQLEIITSDELALEANEASHRLKDVPRLQGTWNAVSLNGGKVEPKRRWKFVGQKFEILEHLGQGSWSSIGSGRFEISSRSLEIDIWMKVRYKPREYLGKYGFRDRGRELLLTLGATERPEYAHSQGEDLERHTLRRVSFLTDPGQEQPDDEARLENVNGEWRLMMKSRKGPNWDNYANVEIDGRRAVAKIRAGTAWRVIGRGQVRAALSRGELDLSFSPVVDPRKGRVEVWNDGGEWHIRGAFSRGRRPDHADETGDDIEHWELVSVQLEPPKTTPLEGRWRLFKHNGRSNHTDSDVYWEISGKQLHWYRQHFEDKRQETIRRYDIDQLRLETNVLDLKSRRSKTPVQTLVKLEHDRLLVLLRSGNSRGPRPVSWYDRRGNELLEFHREPKEDI